VFAVLCVLILVGAGAALLAWAIEGTPKRLAHPTVDDYLNVLKLLLAIIAGLGAAVGLVVTYRRQRTLESEALTTRFSSASEQLGHKAAAVRLAGVSAMARLADEWEEQRQMCVDVLCAYLRMPYVRGQAPHGEREVRLTVMRAIGERLGNGKWVDLDFDLTGAVFDGDVLFENPVFSGGRVWFTEMEFFGTLTFLGGEFSGGVVSFVGSRFSAGFLNFAGSEFLLGSSVSFAGTTCSGGTVSFEGATFSGGIVDLRNVSDWSHPPRGLSDDAPGLILPDAWKDEGRRSDEDDQQAQVVGPKLREEQKQEIP
jgi:hypothetical protein